MTFPKRLIEVDLPIARISAHARREKSIRHGHISTLHIWWARRPLAACRAVICASLWPDPADELCPTTFREAAVVILREFAKRAAPSYVPQSEGGASISDETRRIEAGLSAESRARWEALAAGTLTMDPAEPTDMAILRMALLDFIADFANWDNSTVPAYLETSRQLTGVAHASLSDATYQLPMSFAKLSAKLVKEAKAKAKKSKVVVGGVGEWLDALDQQLADLPRPLVVDPFAGGGSIPLESLRVGADAFASDLNPIPVLLNKVVLEYIPTYGKRLADEVRKWGEWIKIQAEKELSPFYPKDADGATPIAYLWARTIRCEGPACGAEVPLIRSLWLAKKANRSVALRLIPKSDKKLVDIDIVELHRDGWVSQSDPSTFFKPSSFSSDGTVKRGSATCPCCGYTTPVSRVREQFKARHGGANDARLLAAVIARKSEDQRDYRLPTQQDFDAVKASHFELTRQSKKSDVALSLIPDEPTPLGGGKGAGRAFSQRIYGMDKFGDLFTSRQLLSLTTLARLVRESSAPIAREIGLEFGTAVSAVLGLCASKLADLLNSLCSWQPSNDRATHLFARQAIQITWDFAESTGASNAVGNFGVSIANIARILDREAGAYPKGHVERASATSHPMPDDAADAFITDPPYYDAIPYSDLSDFFYVWLRRSLSGLNLLPEDHLTPKIGECIVDDAKGQDAAYFERLMSDALAEGRRVVKPSGIGVVVFAHKSTAGWETQLQALINAGWVVTGSWPVDTEWGTRLRAMNSASLASSVHLICRPREYENGAVIDVVGEWRDVLGELPKRIHEWMPRLAAEGVVGADAIFACLGPALEIFSRYSRVEKANGDTATLREYLEFVWAAVSTEALSLIFKDADAAGLEPDARLIAMWLWTLGGGNAAGEQAVDGIEETEESRDDEDTSGKVAKLSGFTLEYDAARKIAQGLGVHLEQCQTLVEVKGDKARMLPVKERAESLFGKSGAAAANQSGGKAAKKKATQKSLFDEMIAEEPASNSATWGDLQGPTAGSTVLDRVHQSMILFAAGRGELLKRFLVEDGIGKDARFWKLAQSLSALYPKECEEKRWVDGVLARKKGLGL
jgi:putative DNA methylase